MCLRSDFLRVSVVDKELTAAIKIPISPVDILTFMPLRASLTREKISASAFAGLAPSNIS